MSHYVKRPEPGRFIKKETIIERIIEKPKEETKDGLDVTALANAIAQAINIKIPQNLSGNLVTNDDDSFDNSKTMQQLATQMLVQRGNNEANFDDLGNVKETKKDQKDVDDTIDLLSKLDN